MNSSIGGHESVAATPRRGIAPALTLIVLAPLIAEVLSGATRLSYIFAFIPEMMVWGCGALIIRELVRRWHGAGTSMLMLGLALAIAEEFIIQQTSLAPMPWISGPTYGREWGVNWLYFLFMLGYESVWVVLIPVQLTELLFPERRDEPWLKTRGVVISAAVFLVGSYVAWFAWTQRARPMTFHVPVYHPSPELLAIGALSIVVLAIVAYSVRNVGLAKRDGKSAPPLWLVAIAMLALAFPWYGLLTVIFAPTLRPHFSFWVLMGVGLLWAGIAYAAIRHWSSASGWNDVRRWSVVFAATLVSMVAGFAGSSTWLKADLIAKAVLDAIAAGAFVWLGVLIRRRH